MAKLITKFRYYKSNSSLQIGGYIRYMATRDGAEKCDDSSKYKPVTNRQIQMIKQLCHDFPDSKFMLEYKDYLDRPCLGTAHEFISRAIEDNALEAVAKKTYADYIATRPGVVKTGAHGLFNAEEKEINLTEISDELNAREDNIWTMIVSLRREDAERLGYNTARKWKYLIGSVQDEISDAMKIPLENLKWYAAFHNESYHPHIHVILYSAKASEGHLTPQGVDKIRSSLAKTIFKQDYLHIYEGQTKIRDTLKQNWKQNLQKILNRIEKKEYKNPAIEQLLIQLALHLSQVSGKKQYGYLNKNLKDMVDAIVNYLAEDKDISRLYDLWWQAKCEVLKQYSSTLPPKIPLSQNKEFKSLKNDIIREAVRIYAENEKDFKIFPLRESKNSQYLYRTSTISTATAVTCLFKDLAGLFQTRIASQMAHNHPSLKIDKRKKREIEAKKNAEIAVY